MSFVDEIAGGLKASFVSQLLKAASNALLILLLTRVFLTPNEYGQLHFALSILAVVTLGASLGLPKSTARYVAEYLETDTAQIPHILRVSVGVMLGLTVVAGLLLAAFGTAASTAMGKAWLPPFLLVGIGYVATYAFVQYLINVFQGFNRVTWSAVVVSASSVGRVVFAVGFVAAGLGALGALLGYTAGFALAVVIGGVVLYRRFYAPYVAPGGREEGLTRRLLEYSVPLTATRSASVIDSKLDSVVVGLLLNATAVGYYTLARQIAEFCIMPASSLGFTISPTFRTYKTQGELAKAATVYENALRYVFSVYLPLATGLVLVAAPTIRLVIGASYLDAVPVVQVFALYVVAVAVNKVTTDALDYLGLARRRAVAKMLMAVANLALNLFLIPRIGVVGAAVATVVTFSAYTGLNVYSIHRELSFRVRYVARLAAIGGGISAAMALVVVVARPHITGVPTLGGVVFLGGCVWFVLAVGSGVLDVDHVAALLR